MSIRCNTCKVRKIRDGTDPGRSKHSSTCMDNTHSLQFFLETKVMCPGFGLAAVGLVFEYLAMLRAAGTQRWVHDELSAIQATRFRFQEEQDACNYVSGLAADMHNYQPEHALVGEYLCDKWDPELVRCFLGVWKGSSKSGGVVLCGS